MLLALTKDSSVIRLESHHLNIFSTDDGENHTVPLSLVERVILTDIPRISGAVIQELLVRKIPVTFVSGKGEFLGQVHFSPAGECKRRKLQYKMSDEYNLLPVYKLLEAKLYNQKRLLQRLSASHHKEAPECLDISRQMKSLKRQNALATF